MRKYAGPLIWKTKRSELKTERGIPKIDGNCETKAGNMGEYATKYEHDLS